MLKIASEEDTLTTTYWGDTLLCANVLDESNYRKMLIKCIINHQAISIILPKPTKISKNTSI